VPSSLLGIVPVLHVADEADATHPRVAYICTPFVVPLLRTYVPLIHISIIHRLSYIRAGMSRSLLRLAEGETPRPGLQWPRRRSVQSRPPAEDRKGTYDHLSWTRFSHAYVSSSFQLYNLPAGFLRKMMQR
jgi:hypothetical protein